MRPSYTVRLSPVPLVSRSDARRAVQFIVSQRPICKADSPASIQGRFTDDIEDGGRWPHHVDAKVVKKLPNGDVVKKCPHCGYSWVEFKQ
jgi:hypothetical protein